MTTKNAKSKTNKQFGVDFFTTDEFEDHIRTNRLSLPFRLEDIAFQIRQAADRGGMSGDQMFYVYSMITLQQWKLMLNHTIVAAQKASAQLGTTRQRRRNFRRGA